MKAPPGQKESGRESAEGMECSVYAGLAPVSERWAGLGSGEYRDAGRHKAGGQQHRTMNKQKAGQEPLGWPPGGK